MPVRKCRKCGKDFQVSLRELLWGSAIRYSYNDPSFYLYCDTCREEIRNYRIPRWQSTLIYSFMLFCFAVVLFLVYKPPNLLISVVNRFETNLSLKTLWLLIFTLPVILISIKLFLKKKRKAK